MSNVNVTVFCFLASYVVAFGLEIARWVRQVSINRAVMLFAAAAGMVAHLGDLSQVVGFDRHEGDWDALIERQFVLAPKK